MKGNSNVKVVVTWQPVDGKPSPAWRRLWSKLLANRSAPYPNEASLTRQPIAKAKNEAKLKVGDRVSAKNITVEGTITVMGASRFTVQVRWDNGECGWCNVRDLSPAGGMASNEREQPLDR
jgi:hypothetical protein